MELPSGPARGTFAGWQHEYSPDDRQRQSPEAFRTRVTTGEHFGSQLVGDQSMWQSAFMSLLRKVLVLLVCCSSPLACSSDRAAEQRDPAGIAGADARSGGSSIDLPDVGQGGADPMAPDDCSPAIRLDDSSCRALSSIDLTAETVCLTWEELNDPCSAIQLRALTDSAHGGAGGGAQTSTSPTSVDECPTHEDVIFGIQGPACGARHFDPVCDHPAEMVDGACCYAVITYFNAC